VVTMRRGRARGPPARSRHGSGRPVRRLPRLPVPLHGTLGTVIPDDGRDRGPDDVVVTVPYRRAATYGRHALLAALAEHAGRPAALAVATPRRRRSGALR